MTTRKHEFAWNGDDCVCKFCHQSIASIDEKSPCPPLGRNTTNNDYLNRPAYLRQIADEMDAEFLDAAKVSCSEASIIREAADEIERLRALVIHYADQAGVTAEEVKRVHNV